MQSETHNKPTCKCVAGYMTVFLGHRFVCVIILSNSSIDRLGDTVTGFGGPGHHAPLKYIL